MLQMCSLKGRDDSHSAFNFLHILDVAIDKFCLHFFLQLTLLIVNNYLLLATDTIVNSCFRHILKAVL